MSAKKHVFSANDKVFAKVRGYPFWPARIDEVAGSGAGVKYNVFFYGTYETATVKRDEVVPYTPATKAKYGKQKRKGFAEGLIEIETNPDIRTQEELGELDEVAAESISTEPAKEKEKPKEEAEDKTEKAEEKMEVEEKEEEKETQEAAEPEPVETPSRKPVETPSRSRRKSGVATPQATPTPTPTPRSLRTNKRKAESSAGPAESKKMRMPEASAENTPTTTSRSGRVIRPKKFGDDVAAEATATPKADETPKSAKKAASPQSSETRKMWVQVKATGDVVEINLDKDRPISFDSKDAELQWDRATAKNALKFKEKVEAGEFIPDEVLKKLEAKTTRTEEEEAIIKKGRQTAIRKEQIRLLKIEQRLVDLDVEIKKALHIDDPKMDKCLDTLTELSSLAVTPLMFKKQPQIVNTLRKLRKYLGPKSVSDTTESENFTVESQKIRIKADQIYAKIQAAFMFNMENESNDFWKEFEEAVTEFKNATKGMETNKVLALVTDPTKQK